MTNALKTYILMAILIALVVGVGELLGGRDGLIIGLIISLGMSFFSYWFSDSIILTMYGARKVPREAFPELHAIVERLSERAGIPKPAIYIIPTSSPNAFATGRGPSKSAVAVTEGLLGLLSREELEGVIAHEIAHIANYDVLLSTIVAVLAGSLSFVTRMFYYTGGRSRDDNERGNPILALIMMILAPLIALIIQMAISRSREYLADETGARFCGNPRWLASALERLQYAVAHHPFNSAHEATSHMFIVHPFSGGGIAEWFSTHPPMKERIARLMSMRI